MVQPPAATPTGNLPIPIGCSQSSGRLAPALLRFLWENLAPLNSGCWLPVLAAHGYATAQREEHIMKKSSSNKFDRRKFLAGVAVAGAAAVTSEAGKAAILRGGKEPPHVPAASRPSSVLAQAEISTKSVPAPAGGNPNLTKGRPGSDFMLDCIKTLDIDYV